MVRGPGDSAEVLLLNDLEATPVLGTPRQQPREVPLPPCREVHANNLLGPSGKECLTGPQAVVGLFGGSLVPLPGRLSFRTSRHLR